MPKLNALLGAVINIGRSLPFIVLLIALIPFTRLIVGTTLGSTAAIVPVTIGAFPFFARLTENALDEVDYGRIEAILSMGGNVWHVIFKSLLPGSPANAAGRDHADHRDADWFLLHGRCDRRRWTRRPRHPLRLSAV